MSKPIIPILLALLLVASGCSVDVTRGVRDTVATTLDVLPPLPACATCLRCPQSVGAQGTVLATRRHRFDIPAGGVTSPRPVTFTEIEQDTLVGVHIQGVGRLDRPGTLVLSYADCPADRIEGRQFGIVRLASLGSQWVAVPGVVHDAVNMQVTVQVTQTSRYAVTTE
jgi:hypothetical protein